jgi:hypothetical protein
MTNREFLIQELCSGCKYISKDIVEQIFDIINEKDWRLFSVNVSDECSQELKVQANAECFSKLDKLVNGNVDISNSVSHIYISLLPDIYDTGKFYAEHFFEMNNEYKED